MRPRRLRLALLALLPTLSLTLAASPSGAVAAQEVAPTASADHPLGNLAATPPMGWSSWNTFGCDISAQMVKDSADALVKSGMAASGYKYVNIDDCWSTKERNAEGQLVPDPEKFPEGIKDVADYVHQRGLKLGIYSSAGTTTCADYPASLGHEESDASQWADWGVDLVKYDNCGEHQGMGEQERYQRMADAIAATKRPMVFSLCDWGEGKDWEWNGEKKVGHYYPTTYDICATWDIMMRNGDFQSHVTDYAGPDNWADPDMLVVGVRKFLGEEVPGLTRGESRVHMGVWAITNAPLIAGNDVRAMKPWERELLTNRRVLEIDQDWSGRIGARIHHDADHDIWVKQMRDGSVAALLVNRSTKSQALSVSADDLGLDGHTFKVIDAWTGEKHTAKDAVRAELAGHDAALFRISLPGNRQNS